MFLISVAWLVGNGFFIPQFFFIGIPQQYLGIFDQLRYELHCRWNYQNWIISIWYRPKCRRFFSMIISLIHHRLRKGDEDMFLIYQFSWSETTKKSKKKFLNCIIGVEESRPKLRFRSKLRLKDPRYVNLNFFEIIGWKNSILSNLKKSLFFRCQNERFFYVDYKKKVYIYIGESISKKWCANFALFVRKKNFWPFRDLRTIYVNIDITPAIIVTFV